LVKFAVSCRSGATLYTYQGKFGVQEPTAGYEGEGTRHAPGIYNFDDRHNKSAYLLIDDAVQEVT